MEKESNRIAKIIARSGICSRRDAERKILAGLVEVNGKIIDGAAISPPGPGVGCGFCAVCQPNGIDLAPQIQAGRPFAGFHMVMEGVAVIAHA